MPAVAGDLHILGTRLDIEDVRVAMLRWRVDWSKFPEATGKALVVLSGDDLIAEYQNMMVQECAFDLG